METMKKENTINSIEKTFDLLEYLSGNKKEMGVTEISTALNLGISTVYYYLHLKREVIFFKTGRH